MDYEARLERFYSQVLKPGDVCVDVGAHRGRHTIPLAKAVSASGRILAFEPIDFVAAELKQAVDRDGLSQVEVINHALGRQAGSFSFVLALDALEYSGLRERVYDSPTRLRNIEVAVQRLDDVVAQRGLPAVHYMKIDTEGGEWDVIQGAADTIRRWNPVVTFEFGANSYRKYDVDPGEVHRFFAEHGYAMFDILGKRLDRPEFEDSSERQQVWDYAAIAESDAAAYARWLAD
ncbi:FkbM family methyltransferase [Lysobacter enzymogenes]|jgi:FkbM family methyltransferase|uniref:FkbM family methyltransferase n=1 Tax=Lysobacter enzymogenes TaxID=69 RepID=UPI000899C5C3|nr:FkbM family methyltransferase [Lysobacter enzymogenes]SDW23372.1 methyltransferase, FkbM family [Lysobacter enzymogenes]